MDKDSKICSKCNKEKPVDSFSKNQATLDGLQYMCKLCQKATDAGWKKKNPRRAKELYRRRNLKQYGLTVEAYGAMLKGQNGVCKICRELPDKKQLAVDHCHKTNQIRGLLCSRCNTALGLFRDSTVLMKSAIDYLNGALL